MAASTASVWTEVKDGDPIGRQMFRRHYSYNRRRDQMSIFASVNRNYGLFVGPGEKLVLLSSCQRALFAWRKFTGGLEAAALQDYQVGLLADLKPRPNCFFAYDPGDPFETLKSAAERMIAAGFTARSHRLRVYVLIGFPKDTFEAADKRLRDMLAIGFTPHAMLWQPETPAAERYRPTPEWRRFQRLWARPSIIHAGGVQ